MIWNVKYCKYCEKDKPYDPTAKKNSKASGFQRARCWDCECLRTKQASIATRATQDGLVASRLSALAWSKANRGKANALSMSYYTKKKLRVMPWTEHDAIKALYIEANSKGLQVDHIYPIRSTKVSGLHVLANLQLLTPFANASKGNRIGEMS